MKFSLSGKRFQDSYKDITVSFPDGYADKIILRKHYFNEEEKINSGANGLIQLIVHEL